MLVLVVQDRILAVASPHSIGPILPGHTAGASTACFSAGRTGRGRERFLLVRPCMALGAIWRSLEHRNFRLFFSGQILSLVGTWMQLTALPWLVYRLTDSPQWLGLVTFAGQFPASLFAPLAGVAAERFNKRRLLLITQVLAMT